MFPSASFLQTTAGKIISSSLWSQRFQCIPQLLSSLFPRIPTETHGNQDLSLFFSSQPSFPLVSLLPSLVTPPLEGVTISRCQQPTSPVAGGSWPCWAWGSLILTGTQAAAKKSHREIPFPCDFYAGEHSGCPGSIQSCCLCQEFYSQRGSLGLR